MTRGLPNDNRAKPYISGEMPLDAGELAVFAAQAKQVLVHHGTREAADVGCDPAVAVA